MELFGVIVVLFVLFAIAAAIDSTVKKSSGRKAMIKHIKELPDFDMTQQIMGADGTTGLSVDESRKKVCLVNKSDKTLSSRVVDYRDILSTELFEDGTAVTKTSRSSQLGGALLGGLAFGALGAVVGGLSGSTSSATKVKRIDLQIVVNDVAAPIHRINFLDLESKTDTSIYKQASEKARHWNAIIGVT
jgi:hypothetical protein